jgi:hypothetical protein
VYSATPSLTQQAISSSCTQLVLVHSTNKNVCRLLLSMPAGGGPLGGQLAQFSFCVSLLGPVTVRSRFSIPVNGLVRVELWQSLVTSAGPLLAKQSLSYPGFDTTGLHCQVLMVPLLSGYCRISLSLDRPTPLALASPASHVRPHCGPSAGSL